MSRAEYSVICVTLAVAFSGLAYACFLPTFRMYSPTSPFGFDGLVLVKGLYGTRLKKYRPNYIIIICQNQRLFGDLFSSEFHIVCLTVTRISVDIASTNYFLSNFTVCRSDHHSIDRSTGGGVLLDFDNFLNCVALPDIETYFRISG